MQNPVSIAFVLDEINKNTDLLKTKYAFKNGSPLHKVFVFGYNQKYKFLLPDGIPPFKRVKNIEGQNNEYLFSSIINNAFNSFVDRKVPNSVRETQFIQLLECIDEKEADILLHIKDQTLVDLYPNITYTVLRENGYVFPDPLDEKREEERITQSNKSNLESEKEPASDLETHEIDRNKAVATEDTAPTDDHQADGGSSEMGNPKPTAKKKPSAGRKSKAVTPKGAK